MLATVGSQPVTSEQLEQALRSSPFATQYLTLDADAQAALWRDLLQRLVQAEILYQEAKRLRLDKDRVFQKEVAEFERALLAQKYLEFLRARIEVPEKLLAKWRTELDGDPDALAAAHSAYIAKRYQAVKAEALSRLQQRCGKLAENALLACGAKKAGIDVASQVTGFRRERLIQRLLEIKEREWRVNDEQTLRAWYARHPELGRVPERRHVAQIVVASRQEAEKLRRRLLNGESLFRLAKKYSIDPEGRKNAGDLGWLPERSAMPEIEEVLASLKDGELSPVIETPKGFHLVVIVERRPAEQKPFAVVRDRVQRALLSEREAAYLNTLRARYPIRWQVDEL
ncbi:peptidylprolyl isomerase [Methylothermus subterraneus]